MTRDVVVIPPELSLQTAWRIMTRERIRHLPVVRANALIGMISDRDVLANATIGKDGTVHVPGHILVAEAMTSTPLETCEAGADVSDLARAMVEKKIDAIPVVQGLRLVGLVTSTDLIGLLITKEEAGVFPFEFRIVENVACA